MSKEHFAGNGVEIIVFSGSLFSFFVAWKAELFRKYIHGLLGVVSFFWILIILIVCVSFTKVDFRCQDSDVSLEYICLTSL